MKMNGNEPRQQRWHILWYGEGTPSLAAHSAVVVVAAAAATWGGHSAARPPDLPAIAWHAQACQPALPCTYSLTAGKGTRENLFLVPIQPFQPLQRPPWSGVFSTNSRRNYRGHLNREGDFKFLSIVNFHQLEPFEGKYEKKMQVLYRESHVYVLSDMMSSDVSQVGLISLNATKF